MVRLPPFFLRLSAMPARRILVIKFSAFGDFIIALGPFKAIRDHHAGDHVTLLTTAPFKAMAEASGLFDEVWVTDRPRPLHLARWAGLISRLRKGRFDRVYDLQRNDRTALIYRFMKLGRRLEWSGVVKGCSHIVADPRLPFRHVSVKLTEQLAVAGIPRTPLSDLSFLDADLSAFDLPPRIALIVPGGAPHRPEKRAPVALYAEVCRRLLATGITPLLLGTEAEAAELAAIAKAAPGARDLMGQTGFPVIAALARRADLALGNDTGPMHLIAAAGCPSLTMFCRRASNPEEISPLGPKVATMIAEDLADVEAGAVMEALAAVAR